MKPLILVADDDPKHQKLFADVLQAAGYDTLTAPDGQRAVELARSARPDLILMDVDMPVLDGISAVKILKEDPEMRAIPVVAVTALAMTADREHVMNAGFDGFVGKPIHINELRAVVKDHLRARLETQAPDWAPASSPIEGRRAAVESWATASIGRVLVVDDEEKNRRLFRDILEAHGHEVKLAEDGEAALTMAFAESPDAVLLDVMLPGMDGFEVCERLRADTRTGHVPILMVTALQDRASMLTGIRAGANDFLTKPIDPEELRLRVRNAVYAKHLYDKVQDDRVRLEALGTLRDNLTDMIVHDMRSPLLVVSTSFDILSGGADRFSPDERRFHALGEHACREVVDMVNSLLDVSRLEAGEMPLERAQCDIVAIATQAMESVAGLASQKGLTIDLVGDSATVVVDRDILRRAVVNLLGNAIAFSPEGASIAIGIAETDATVRLTVADRGPGIAPEHHNRIFEKFGQVGSRPGGLRPSSGLGLTFCKLAVEAHGGKIGLESHVGGGSTFWIELPRLEAASLPAPQTSA